MFRAHSGSAVALSTARYRMLPAPSASERQRAGEQARGTHREGEGAADGPKTASGIGKEAMRGDRRGAYMRRGSHALLSRRQQRPSPLFLERADERAARCVVSVQAFQVVLPAACWTLPGSRAPAPEQLVTGGRTGYRPRRHERLALRWRWQRLGRCGACVCSGAGVLALFSVADMLSETL